MSPDFDASRRSRDFLCFIAEETLAGRGEAITQVAIATRVFGRKEDFDPLLDPIVRIQAGRLRRSLERYYLLGGKQDSLRIDLPKGSYVPVFRKVTVTEAAAAALMADSPPRLPAVDPWPSVAVSQFEAAPSGPEQEDVAVRLVEELAAELGRYRHARVVLARDTDGLDPNGRSGARFDLRGRLRREEGAWRVSARLVDRTTGEQLWSDDYHPRPGAGAGREALNDVARVIAARVGAESGVIVQRLSGEYLKRPAAEMGAYGAILSSYRFFFSREPQDLAPAVAALQRVVVDEPEISLAWTQLCRLYLANHAFELTDVDTPIDQAVSFAYQGLRLDPSGTRVRCLLSSALLVKGELRASRDELEHALRLNPGSLVYLEIIGYLLALLGDWERGIALVRSAIERNPHHLPHAYFGLWADHLRRGRFEEAYAAALEYRDPTFFWRSLMRACALGHLAREREARAEAAELLRQKPTFPARGRTLIGYYIKPVDLQERVVDGLAKAGLEL
jgi:adenylate cyclase